MSQVFHNKSTQLLYCVVKELTNLDNHSLQPQTVNWSQWAQIKISAKRKNTQENNKQCGFLDKTNLYFGRQTLPEACSLTSACCLGAAAPPARSGKKRLTLLISLASVRRVVGHSRRFRHGVPAVPEHHAGKQPSGESGRAYPGESHRSLSPAPASTMLGAAAATNVSSQRASLGSLAVARFGTDLCPITVIVTPYTFSP